MICRVFTKHDVSQFFSQFLKKITIVYKICLRCVFFGLFASCWGAEHPRPYSTRERIVCLLLGGGLYASCWRAEPFRPLFDAWADCMPPAGGAGLPRPSSTRGRIVCFLLGGPDPSTRGRGSVFLLIVCLLLGGGARQSPSRSVGVFCTYDTHDKYHKHDYTHDTHET